jgi:hypothetical protein
LEGKSLALTVVMIAAAVMGIGMFIMYGDGPPPAPTRPLPPPAPEALMNSELKYSPVVYRGLVESDARTYGVEAPTEREFERPNPYFDQLRGRRKLKAKESFETSHLRLSLDVSKHTASVEGQTFAYDHVVLRIHNKTNKHLAYRVTTEIDEAKKCASKGDIQHNAIALEPNQTITRTECLLRRHTSIDILEIEVIELPALSAYYVSRLPATTVLYDPRTAAGHRPWKGTLCPQTFSWRELAEGIERKVFGWRDVIDFYARHSCEEYSFFQAYRYRATAGDPLPARPS